MRKSVIQSDNQASAKTAHENWLDLEQIAQVEVTSEDANLPVEHALGAVATTGWKASETGPQIIRLRFDAPQTIRRIQLHFVDRETERAQEFALSAGSGEKLSEVVRQQWTFSPHGSTEELEDYAVDLHGVTTLELRIDPDRSHDPKMSREYASLKSLRLA